MLKYNIRKEVTDLILETNKILNLVSNWHVSGEPSLSDHRYIRLLLGIPREPDGSHIKTT
jgi:hypothetical protein